MRQVELVPKVEHLAEMKLHYGMFDLDLNSGRPTSAWEHRNLHLLRLGFPLRHAYFPDFWLKRIQVNQRAVDALAKVLKQIGETWSPEALEAYGLNQFVRCYSFGDGEPSLFWFGAGWQLSPQVGGEILSEAIKIFQQHGWTYCWIRDKRRIREFEYW